jgi:hypothetical protein
VDDLSQFNRTAVAVDSGAIRNGHEEQFMPLPIVPMVKCDGTAAFQPHLAFVDPVI